MRKVSGAMALIAATLFSAVTAIPVRAEDKLKLTTKETSLGKMVAPDLARSLSISADGNHILVMAKKAVAPGNNAARFLVTIDGQPEKDYEWIVAKSITFSADSQRHAYVVQQGGNMFAVVDGKDGKPYFEIANNELMFSPAQARYAYYAKPRAGGKWLTIVDGEEGKEFDTVGNLSFSADGKRVAYGAESAGQQFFVVDGKVGGEKSYEKVSGGSFTWSPDSQRYAYGAVLSGKVLVVADGKESPPYIEASRPIFSADSKHIVYGASKAEKKATVVMDGKELKEFDSIVFDSVAISPDNNRVAYIARKSVKEKDKDGKMVDVDKMFYVLDGQEGQFYEALVRQSFLFSPDSKRYCYQILRKINPKEVVAAMVIDGLEGKDYEEIRLAQFSSDSKKVAYLAKRNNRVFAVVNNAEQKGYDSIGNLMFSSDGLHTAYVASRNNKQFVVIDGIEGKDYDGVVPETVAYSPDGKYLVYEARQEKKPMFVVSTAEASQETPEHAGSLRGSRIIFTSPTTFQTLILRGEADKDKEIFKQVITIGQ